MNDSQDCFHLLAIIHNATVKDHPQIFMYVSHVYMIHSIIARSYGNCYGEGNGNPLQYCCLENPMDGGAWWAPVHGVAESRT